MIMHRGFRFFSFLFTLALLAQLAACGGGDSSSQQAAAEWPIAKDVYTTAEQQILPIALPEFTPQINPRDVWLYEVFGYSAWQVGPALGHVKRTDLAPGNTATNAARLLSFFTITDIHISDKESPAQVNYVG